MNDLQLLPNKPTLAQIQRFAVFASQQPQVAIEPIHHFAGCVYAREITIPAGVAVVGKLHRHEHLIMLQSGDVTIYTDAGMVRLQGPATWVSQAGTKRAIYAHADSVITTIHANPDDLRDLAVLEERIIEPETELLSSQGVLT